MRTLLVFAHECAPFHRPESTIGAQRPAQFAKHLPAFGWRAVVLCCDASRRGSASPSDRAAVRSEIQAEVRARLRAASPTESVVIATPSLAWDGLLDRAWRAAARPGGGRLRATVRRALTAAKLATGDYSQAWQPCARWAAAAVAAEIPVDACLGEHSPDAGIFLARWFARRAGLPWVADFRDPILQPFPPGARRLYGPLARRLVRGAAATVAVNPLWADLDRELFGRPAVAIPNGFDPEEAAAAPAVPRDGRLTVAYAGNVLQPSALEVFLAGLARAQRSQPGLLFRYRGLAAAQVARRVAILGLGGAADVAAFCPREEALGLLATADLLLLLSYRDPGDVYLRQGLYPGKVFEYFGARRPILCVPGDGGQLDALLAETSTGTACATPEAVADALLAARRLQAAGQPLPYAPDEAAIARYTRLALAGRLAELLDRAVSTHENSPDHAHVRHRRLSLA